LTRLIHPESQVELQDHLTLEDAGMPSEHALAAGVVQVYAQKLKKVVVADELQIAPREVTDSELAELCDSIRDDPPDILILCGCRGVTNISCLAQLSTISHLDISRCGLGAEGGFQLAGAIKEMRALSHFDISNNNIRQEGMQALAEALKGNVTVTALIVSSNNMTSDAKGDPGKMAGVIALANAIAGMGAMKKLDTSLNNLRAEGGKVLAAGLKGNQVITELNINSNNLGMNSDYSSDTSGFIAVADAIPYMEALFSLTFSGEQYWNRTAFTEDAIVEDAVTITTAMTDADFSGKHLGSHGATILAAWLSSDKGGTSSVNLLKNQIPVEQAQELVKLMQSKEKLVTLCGLSKEETELDFSGQDLNAGDAVLIANDISDMGALSSLNLAKNLLCGLDECGRGVFDASGNTSPLYAHIPLLTLDHPHLYQVLSPLPMSSPIWGRWRRLSLGVTDMQRLNAGSSQSLPLLRLV
jgi:hypothetical protein